MATSFSVLADELRLETSEAGIVYSTFRNLSSCSVISCAAACLDDSGCVGISYHHNVSFCSLLESACRVPTLASNDGKIIISVDKKPIRDLRSGEPM